MEIILSDVVLKEASFYLDTVCERLHDKDCHLCYAYYYSKTLFKGEMTMKDENVHFVEKKGKGQDATVYNYRARTH